MFKKTISGLSLVAAAFGLAALSTPAAACTDFANQWDCVHGSVPAQYIGSGTIAHWFTGTVACDDAQATVDLVVGGGDMDFAITAFDTSNSSNPTCADITYSNFNWTGTFPGGSNAIRIFTPTANYAGAPVCQGGLDTVFNEDGFGGSYIELGPTMSGWAGTCTFDFTLSNSSVTAH